MIAIFDAATGASLGEISAAQLQFLKDQLEEESLEDQDYYINQTTLDSFAAAGAPDGLVALLRRALAGRDEMDIRWDSE